MPRDEAEQNGYRIDGASRMDTFTADETLRAAVEKVRGRSGLRGIGGSKCVLTQAERKSLSEYIGQPVESAQDARRAMKAKGLRFAEKGEAGYEAFDALREHAETGRPLDERHHIRNIDLWGDGPPKKWDEKRARERYLYHCQQTGQNPNL